MTGFVTAPARTPRRVLLAGRPSAWAGAAVLALALTGCGGASEHPDTATPVSTESATGDASPLPGGSGSPGTAPESQTATSAESAAEFVPASSEGPAQNVPVPEMPEAAKEQTQEGLEAALKYWWETEYYLKSTGDPQPMASVSADDCSLCQRVIINWPELYDANAWIYAEPASIEIEYASLANEDTAGTVLFKLSERPSDVFNPDGKRVQDTSGDGSENLPWNAGLQYSTTEGFWQVENIGEAS